MIDKPASNSVLNSSATRKPSSSSCAQLVSNVSNSSCVTTGIATEYARWGSSKATSAMNTPGLDVFGNDPSKVPSSESYVCTSCQRNYPAARYAPHLEKCLGLSSRRQSARRTGSQSDRSGTSPSTSLHDQDSNGFGEDTSKVLLNGLVDRKRKQPPSKETNGQTVRKRGRPPLSRKASPLLKSTQPGGSPVPLNSLDTPLKTKTTPKSSKLRKMTKTIPIESRDYNFTAGIDGHEDLEEFFQELPNFNQAKSYT
ncbi:Ataxin-7-like protein 3 [Dispira parvispora]|uniref:SAGA-associated factor 11 n=1 Tax=Dispira parvispora TaxID=1520584 RepID=A0A9W8ARY5_9FUNG|nr:Ataxin-7-like protein 3 [Dispira parvispora]